MSKYADKFATVKNKQVVAITDGTPPQELLPNQFALTTEEFYLLRAVLRNDGNLLEYIEKLVTGLKEKVERVSGE